MPKNRQNSPILTLYELAGGLDFIFLKKKKQCSYSIYK